MAPTSASAELERRQLSGRQGREPAQVRTDEIGHVRTHRQGTPVGTLAQEREAVGSHAYGDFPAQRNPAQQARTLAAASDPNGAITVLRDTFVPAGPSFHVDPAV
jgi:hypothetical protein